MNEKIYSVTLADGTIIKNLVKNGDNFISRSEIEEDLFEDNLSSVTINDGEREEVHSNMALTQVTHPNQLEWWFVLRDLTPEEISMLKLKSTVEYIAMMADVELNDF